MKKLIHLTYIVLLSFNTFSQVIENVDFNFVDDKIVIFYDLVDCNSNFRYEIGIRFVDERGNTVIPRTLTGDHGLVTCGRNKVAEWELFREVNQFEGNYKAMVSVESIRNRYGQLIEKPGNNTILFSSVLIFAPIGIKYHYSRAFGAYLSISSYFVYADGSVMLTAGASKSIARTLDLYVGAGLGRDIDDALGVIIFEGGLLKKNKNRLSYELGVLLINPVDYGKMPGFRLGVGYNF